jgi:hypothetical protein
MSEKTVGLIVKVGVLAILTLFYVLGVFGTPTPGIDKEIIADHFHPFTVLDFIGTALFTACALGLGGFGKLVGFDPWSKGAGLNVGMFAVGVLGLVLIAA